MISYVLKIKNGKYVTVKNDGGSMKLFAEEIQTKNVYEAHIVHIWEREQKEMAFCCQHETEYYSPTVTDNLELKLVKITDFKNPTLDDKSWFKRVDEGNGNFYRLQTVAQPKKYLCVSGTVLSIDEQVTLYIRHMARKVSP